MSPESGRRAVTLRSLLNGPAPAARAAWMARLSWSAETLTSFGMPPKRVASVPRFTAPSLP